MNITISNLPPDIQQQIPLSLRLSTDNIDSKDLPAEVQYNLNNYFLLEEVDAYRPTVIYDATFNYSIYNDLEILDTKKKTIVEYIQNYLNTSRGSYPFDPAYGNLLKYHLQTKDTELRKILISNELTNLISLINKTFNSQIKILNSAIIRHDLVDHTEYSLNLELEIDKTAVAFTLS